MRIGKTTAKAIIECVKAIDLLTLDTEAIVRTETIHENLSMSFEYVNDAIEAAILLNFIKKDKSLMVTKQGTQLVNSTADELQTIFRKQLEELPLFKEFIDLLSKGKNFGSATNEIINSYNIQGTKKEILYTLRNLLKFAKLIE